jgi:hypothetical protein
MYVTCSWSYGANSYVEFFLSQLSRSLALWLELDSQSDDFESKIAWSILVQLIASI